MPAPSFSCLLRQRQIRQSRWRQWLPSLGFSRGRIRRRRQRWRFRWVDSTVLYPFPHHPHASLVSGSGGGGSGGVSGGQIPQPSTSPSIPKILPWADPVAAAEVAFPAGGSSGPRRPTFPSTPKLLMWRRRWHWRSHEWIRRRRRRRCLQQVHLVVLCPVPLPPSSFSHGGGISAPAGGSTEVVAVAFPTGGSGGSLHPLPPPPSPSFSCGCGGGIDAPMGGSGGCGPVEAAAVALALPRADLAEAAVAVFPAVRSGGRLPPSPPAPKLLP